MSLTARSWRAALRQASRQNLTTSAIRQRHTLPTFELSSTPELTELFDLARRRILVPAHLNAAQEALVYREKHRARLSASAPEPVWSTVAGADVELEHVDRQRDIPRRWRVYADALRLAETRGDWENVVLLMEGLADAGVKLRDEWLQKFVRAAAAKGQLQVVVRALQRVERTGVRLRSAAMVERVLWEVRGEASRAGWAQAETERAAVWAEQVVELMESREHCGGGVRVVKGDLRTLPFVIATPLELVAVRAVRHNEGVDEAGLVKAYAERLCANLKIYGAQVQEPDFAETEAEEGIRQSQIRYRSFSRAGHRLRRLVPVWHALTLSQRVLGDSMPLDKTETYRFATELREEIERAIETMRENLHENQSIEEHGDYQAWQEVKDE